MLASWATVNAEVQTMMTIVRVAICVGFLAACSASLASDLYRCDLKDRRVVYQGSQCEIGVQQRAVDPVNARREQIRKSLEQERLQKRQKSEETAVTGNS
jgi:hypothetical protein